MYGNLGRRLEKIEAAKPKFDPNYSPTIYIYGQDDYYISEKDQEILEEMKKYEGIIDVNVTIGEYTED